MYLYSDFSGYYGELIYELQLINLIKNRNELSKECLSYYQDYIDECLKDDSVSCLYSYIDSMTDYFENFVVYSVFYQGLANLQISFTNDVFNFIAYDYYLSNYGHTENKEIHDLLEEITSFMYQEQLDFEIKKFEKGKSIEYGLIEDTEFFIGPFYVKQTLEQLIKLDKLITERKFVFKLKDLHRKKSSSAGLFFYFYSILQNNFSLIINMLK